MTSTPSPVLVAALKGEFGKSYDGRKLRAATQQALVDLFAGRGESLVDVVQHIVITKRRITRLVGAHTGRQYGHTMT